jgi:hypothetical protein
MRQPYLSIIALVVIALAISNGGCRSRVNRGPIPGWVGIPANLLAPNSLEAETYRNYRHQRRNPPIASEAVGVQVLSIQDSESDPEDSPVLEEGTSGDAETNSDS